MNARLRKSGEEWDLIIEMQSVTASAATSTSNKAPTSTNHESNRPQTLTNEDAASTYTKAPLIGILLPPVLSLPYPNQNDRRQRKQR